MRVKKQYKRMDGLCGSRDKEMVDREMMMVARCSLRWLWSKSKTVKEKGKIQSVS
jgi:hypothetical protein